jgi:hypothetical protein
VSLTANPPGSGHAGSLQVFSQDHFSAVRRYGNFDHPSARGSVISAQTQRRPPGRASTRGCQPRYLPARVRVNRDAQANNQAASIARASAAANSDPVRRIAVQRACRGGPPIGLNSSPGQRVPNILICVDGGSPNLACWAVQIGGTALTGLGRGPSPRVTPIPDSAGNRILGTARAFGHGSGRAGSTAWRRAVPVMRMVRTAI